MALCPSGQGVGLELRWALPAPVRTRSVSLWLRPSLSHRYLATPIGKLLERVHQKMRPPGIEPGAQAWEACMLPLHYVRLRPLDPPNHGSPSGRGEW